MSKIEKFKHPLYIAWCNMKQRCYNKNRVDYKYYGGKGIEVAGIWLNNYAKFCEWSLINGWQKGMTLDRKNGEKHYCPPNCRWTTKAIQARNAKLRESNSSGYIGVTKDKRNGNWYASVCVNGASIALGYHGTAKEAALIRDNYILQNGLKGYKLNFNLPGK